MKTAKYKATSILRKLKYSLINFCANTTTYDTFLPVNPSSVMPTSFLNSNPLSSETSIIPTSRISTTSTNLTSYLASIAIRISFPSSHNGKGFAAAKCQLSTGLFL